MRKMLPLSLLLVLCLALAGCASNQTFPDASDNNYQRDPLSVATATPASNVEGSWRRESPSAPANPPTRAMMTSQMVALELVSSSEVSVERGENAKYKVEVTRQMPICSRRPPTACRSTCMSMEATASAMARAEPMSGQMSIAPMTASSTSGA